jgi:hypothetical protein
MERKSLRKKKLHAARTTDTMCSRETGHFAPLASLVDLGNRLVKELKLERGGDTLTRWMAHHLAEAILRAKAKKGEDRHLAEQECCDLILKIWKHRSALPTRPLASFGPIFQVLERLNSNPKSWYLNSASEGKGGDGLWIKYAEQIDCLVPRLLRFCVSEAVASAGRKESKWLESKALKDTAKSSEVDFIFRLVESKDDLRDPKHLRDAEIKAIINTIDELLEVASHFKNKLGTGLKK